MGINQCSARLWERWEGYPVGNLLLSAKHISHKCDHISRLDFQTSDNISHCFVCLVFEEEEDGDEIHLCTLAAADDDDDDGEDGVDDDFIDALTDTSHISAVPSRKPCGGKS